MPAEKLNRIVVEGRLTGVARARDGPAVCSATVGRQCDLGEPVQGWVEFFVDLE